MSDRLADYVAEIDRIDHQIEKLQAERRSVDARRRAVKGQLFKEANNVTRDDIQMVGVAGMPYHSTIYGFIQWLRENKCTKRFAEWNTEIHFTSELLAGRLGGTGVHLSDLGFSR